MTYLRENGLPDAEARIYTAVLCRQYRAPREELISLLKYHLPGLAASPSSMEGEIGAALDRLVGRGLLKVIDGMQEDPLEACTPWAEALEKKLLDDKPLEPSVAAVIASSLGKRDDFSRHELDLIERLGWATWERPRDCFREAIGEAKQRIRMGVYSSITVYNEVAQQIREAMVARRELNVQILMFSPRLAAKIEGNPDLARDVEVRTKSWRLLFKEARRAARKEGNRPRLEIRHVQEGGLTALHRVLLVDDRRWMLNVHRPGVERGVEGIVYQGCSENNAPSTIYHLLDHYWHAAWESAVDPSPLGRALHQLRQHLHLAVLCGLIFLAWYAERHGGDWLGLKKELWTGAFLGLILAELYTKGLTILRGLLGLLVRLGAWLQSLLPERG